MLKIKLWGVRGSSPSPYTPQWVRNKVRKVLSEFLAGGHSSTSEIDEFLENKAQHEIGGYGGNTSCVEINSRKQQVIIDAGSGIRELGYQLMDGPCGKGKGEVHVFFTHFHWDHVLGLPFFAPIYVAGNRIHVHSVQPDLKEVFQTLFKKPFFPVPLSKLAATVQYHQLKPREVFKLDDLRVTPYQLDHPDPCWGYRVESDGKSVAYCVDTECKRVSAEALGPDRELYENADLMIFDGQYTIKETIEKIDWGHAAASKGLDIALREKVKRILFVHHDPASTDEKIAIAEQEARQHYLELVQDQPKNNRHQVEWDFSYEGYETVLE